MKIRKIAILGAGAVGTYLLWGLSHKPDLEVVIAAKGKRKERLETEGLVVNGDKIVPNVCEPESIKDADLLIVSVKYDSLRDSLSDISTIVNENTMVMSLMNGVDSEEIISEVVDSNQIIYSLIKIASERVGNEVRFDPETTIGMIYGEKDLNRGAERCDALDELFADTGLKYRRTDCIESEIWNKFRLNVPNNQPQAIIGCGVGAYQDSEHVAFIQDKLKEELEKIAEAKGIDLSQCDDTSLVGSKVKKRARYSTLQDLDAKRHTEVDMFAGALIRMGRELNIPTPYNECVYHFIKALEEKNDGLFDYD